MGQQNGRVYWDGRPGSGSQFGFRVILCRWPVGYWDKSS